MNTQKEVGTVKYIADIKIRWVRVMATVLASLIVLVPLLLHEIVFSIWRVVFEAITHVVESFHNNN